MAMIILLLAILAIGFVIGQEEAAIIAPIKPLPVDPIFSITCANVLCIMNSTCVMYEAHDGKMKPYCLPIDYKNTCANTKCKLYEKCVMAEVTCVKAPCYPVPECRPRLIVHPPIEPLPFEPLPFEPLPIEAARKKRQTKTDPRCPGKNQVYSSCSICRKTCEIREPEFCISICRSGCVCKEGFFRDKLGECITGEECDNLAE
ncbi:hypothetical protein B9Z55_021803 [Caenorhabditis nigoni]|uniref:TIL domain-containing protein n=2 Tax=Caenorhabditis nigoni TaxID=1611254 RepID=A0A2G5TTP3_9PELO|nr:hypothetical protein B9Z55_021803 [Caenorhabditis nigoni]